MNKKATFSERLKDTMALRGMTKAELSRITGISKSSLTHYEKGDWEGKQDAVWKIAHAMDVPEAWLMGFGSTIEEFQSEEQKQPPAAGELSEDEVILLQAYRALPEHEKQNVLSLLRLAAGQAQGDQGGPG